MNTLRSRRIIWILLLILTSVLIVFFIIQALRHNINFFYTPSQIYNNEAKEGRRIRLGGMVIKGSIIRKENLSIQFKITDFDHQMIINYHGILPDLFKEEQGVVAIGYLKNKEFWADQILAKHDENYMPAELRDLTKNQKNK